MSARNIILSKISRRLCCCVIITHFLLFSRYTLLIGHPPFETKSLRETYNRIRNNEYTIPSRISDSAANLIQKMLHANPAKRPSLEEILADEFFKKGFFPNRLPASIVTTSPKWSEYEKSGDSEKKISNEAIQKITRALTRQMTLTADENEGSLGKECNAEEVNKEDIGNAVSSSEKDSGLCELNEILCNRDTGQEGKVLQ